MNLRPSLRSDSQPVALAVCIAGDLSRLLYNEQAVAIAGCGSEAVASLPRSRTRRRWGVLARASGALADGLARVPRQQLSHKLLLVEVELHLLGEHLWPASQDTVRLVSSKDGLATRVWV